MPANHTPRTTVSLDPGSDAYQGTEGFEQELLDEILSLTPAACAEFLETLTQRMGYENAAPLDGPRQPVGRPSPSIDLLAERPVPGGRRPVLVRLKRYRSSEPVFRRYVDELRGVALRRGAAEAVLITTSSFPPSVVAAGYPSQPVVPVRLIDGAELVRLCATHRVGVWQEVQASPDSHGSSARGVERAFFRSLGTSRCVTVKRAGAKPAFRVSVAVRVFRTAPCRRHP
jgi:hypothetical protein